MRKTIYILLCMLGSHLNAQPTQQYLLYNNDTINYTDANNLKQGNWIFFGKDKKIPGYKNDQIVEEGQYVDNSRTGVWKKYFPNANLQNEITYVNNRPNGHAKIYYENGNLKEEGLWKGNKWVGDYKFYHENGNVYQDFAFNTTGKREGVQKYFYDSGQVMIEGKWQEGKESGVVKEYYEDGEVKAEKFYSGGTLDPGSTIIYEKAEPVKEKPKVVISKVVVEKDEKPNVGIFDGNGYHKLYDKNKQVSKDGLFKNNKLIDGKWYRYNPDGILLRIEVYKNGAYIGDEQIESQ